MKVYLAGAYAAREQLKEIAGVFEAAGHRVTSRWLEATHEIAPGTVGVAPDHDDQLVYQHASEDFQDIRKAEALVVFVPGPGVLMGNTGGRHVETGFALARGKIVVVVGVAENIFHRAFCLVVPDLQAALEALDGNK